LDGYRRRVSNILDYVSSELDKEKVTLPSDKEIKDMSFHSSGLEPSAPQTETNEAETEEKNEVPSLKSSFKSNSTSPKHLKRVTFSGYSTVNVFLNNSSRDIAHTANDEKWFHAQAFCDAVRIRNAIASHPKSPFTRGVDWSGAEDCGHQWCGEVCRKPRSHDLLAETPGKVKE
jgi:hypothetical protein